MVKSVFKKIKDLVTAGLARLAKAFGPLKKLASKLGINIEEMDKMKSAELRMYERHADLLGEGLAPATAKHKRRNGEFWACLKVGCRDGHEWDPEHYDVTLKQHRTRVQAAAAALAYQRKARRQSTL